MGMSLRKLLCGSLLCLGAAQAQATPITLSGAFFDVAFDDALVSNYGQPSLVGSTLFFTPTVFKAQSLNGAGTNTASATINVQIMAHGGYRFTGIDLSEAGDYKLRAAHSSAGVGGTLNVTDSAHTLLATDSIIATSALNNRDGINHDWSALAGINLDFPIWSGVQTLDLILTNTLEATTLLTDVGPKLAFIEKKFVGLDIRTAIRSGPATVPEGQSWIILLTGLAMMMLQRHLSARFRLAHQRTHR
ncbi:MAG: hypothetical protein ABL892_04070 [Thiobacillaceae bacterium]